MQSHERFFERADNFERVVKKIPADHRQAKKEDRFQRGLVLFFYVFFYVIESWGKSELRQLPLI